MTGTAAIELSEVRKRFGKNVVLDGVTLRVEPGETFAFLGRNGAGKTTTIRALIGLMKPDAGTVRVLGLDPAKQPIEVRRRVGYLAEDQQMWGWMRVEQLIRFMAPFYPTWDHGLAQKYAAQFELPLKTRVRHLSKGQNVRLGLLLALAHRPELVILDDPALGLDPIMRKEFNRDLVTHLQGEGRTVFYSSHLLYEVEPVADRVAILDKGRIVRAARTDELREQVKTIVLPTSAYRRNGIPMKPLDVKHDLSGGDETAITVDDAASTIVGLRSRGTPHRVIDLNLDEIFEAFVIGRVDAEPAPEEPEVVGRVA